MNAETNPALMNTRDLLAEVSARVLPDGLSIEQVDIEDLREQDVNPRSQDSQMFDQLVSNIKKMSALESVPLCAKVDGKMEIISGHHRIRAARNAGVTKILVLVYDGIERESVVAKQLAHNTIQGKDDPELVKKLWTSITDLSSQFEAFIDPKLFDTIPDAVSFKPVDVDLMNNVKTIIIAFLPMQLKDVEFFVDKCLSGTAADGMYLADRETYDAYIAALQRVRTECNIVSIPTAIAEMARLSTQMLESEPPDGAEVSDYESWISIASMVGAKSVPHESANVIKKALAKMEYEGDISGSNRWKAIELWAADYLAGS